MSGQPFSKAQQLAAHEGRTFRKRANRAEWQRIAGQKSGPCRVCGSRVFIELHHLVSRARGGDDVADNIVPLCRDCHRRVTENQRPTQAALAASLTDSERAYIRSKRG